MRSRKGPLALLLVLSLVVAACAGTEEGESDTTTTAAESPATTDAGESPDTTMDDSVSGGEFEGEEITLLIHPTLFAAAGGEEGLVPEFEDMTGADVEVVTAGVNEYIAAAMVEFAAGTGRYDVIAMENSHLSDEAKSHLLDVAPYIAETSEEWNYDDFPESLKAPVTDDAGTVVGIPYRFAANALYYRADLFEEAGVEVPTTFDEMLAVGEAVKAATGVTPWVQRGLAEEIVHDWLNFFYGHGGQMLSDDNSSCMVNSDAGIAAAEFYRELLANELVPTDLLSISRDDYIARMQRGEVAAGVYFAPYWGRLVDPEESTVSDQMAYALQPTAPGVEPGRTRAAGWYLSVSGDTQSPDASWALVEYITSSENLLRGALEWANAPVRLSTYADPSFVEQFPVAEIWSQALAASAVDPAVPGMPEIVDILSEQIASIVRGEKSAQEGLDAACEGINSVLG